MNTRALRKPPKSKCVPLGDFSGFHPILQNQHRGHAVYGFAALLDGKIGVAQDAVGLARGEPFVPEMHGQAESHAQILGEMLHFFRLSSLISAEAERVADHDFRNLILANNSPELLEIQPLVLAPDGLEPLRSNA